LDPVKLTAPGRGGEHKDDALSREWVNVLVRPKALIRQKDREIEAAKQSCWTEHQIDKWDGDDRDDRKKARFQVPQGSVSGSSRRRGVSATGSALDPSVIFCTVTNASEGMTCLNISKGVTHAAAGFKDSCVRVWRLNEKVESTSKFGCLVEGQWSMNKALPVPLGKGPVKNTLATTSLSSSLSIHGGNGEGRGLKPEMRDVLELYGHSKAVYGVSQSNDDSCRLVLSCSADESIRLWDTSIAQCVGKYSCVGPSWGVSFSPLGYYFASANQVRR
jgi:WD40 repeat protein